MRHDAGRYEHRVEARWRFSGGFVWSLRKYRLVFVESEMRVCVWAGGWKALIGVSI